MTQFILHGIYRAGAPGFADDWDAYSSYYTNREDAINYGEAEVLKSINEDPDNRFGTYRELYLETHLVFKTSDRYVFLQVVKIEE